MSEAAATNPPSLLQTTSQGSVASGERIMIRATPKVSPNTSLDEIDNGNPKEELVDPMQVTAATRISPAVSPEKVADPKGEGETDAEIPRKQCDAFDREENTLHSTTGSRQTPETTVSVVKEEEVVSDLEKSPPESEQETINRVKNNQILVTDEINARAEPNENDDDSSNDDSSYFNDPNHLPEPGSGRRYSASIETSQGNDSAARVFVAGTRERESDASLSLSDDSDENHHHPHTVYPIYQPHLFPQQPMIYSYNAQQLPSPQFMMPPQQPSSFSELYPNQQLTRVHSYNSLVSTSSQGDEDFSASDTSIRNELQNVTNGKHTHGKTPSGRRSPILGEHPPSRLENGRGSSNNPFFASPSTINPSPPTIHQAYPVGRIPHPQPHSMTPDELAAWTAMQHAIDHSLDLRQSGGVGGTTYGQPLYDNNNRSPSQASDLAYSMDSDHPLYQQHQQKCDEQPDVVKRRSKNSRGDRRQYLGRGMRSADKKNSLSQHNEKDGFKAYWRRWLMLMYMSALNLLSDWTCYSVAPIALLTEEAFGNINPEELVVVFLVANGIATASEPIILSRLGLRRTVLLGSLMLMVGSIIKSGGMPPIIQANLEKGHGEWRVYLGFFLVGLSQPLYQCTPALLSASWFPEHERTLATGIALNANQIGIGFAFVFGTLLVSESEDIPQYFGLLSLISTIIFLGTLIQFDDAPPTPPSDTARVIRGTLEVNLPSVRSIVDSVRSIAFTGNLSSRDKDSEAKETSSKATATTQSSKDPVSSVSHRGGIDDYESSRKNSVGQRRRRANHTRGTVESRNEGRRTSGNGSSNRRRSGAHRTSLADTGNGIHTSSPSPEAWRPILNEGKKSHDRKIDTRVFPAPSPMMHGATAPSRDDQSSRLQHEGSSQQQPPLPYVYHGYPSGQPGTVSLEQGVMYNAYAGLPPQFWNQQQYQEFVYFQQQQQQQQHPHREYEQEYGGYPYHGANQYFPYHSYQHGFSLPSPQNFTPVALPSAGRDEGVEPTITFKPHQLDIEIRDDQIFLSIKACMTRPGFIHALVSFAVSGIVINTLSTFMDYLVRLNGAGKEYTGIIGGSFQFATMISSLLIGKVCDKTRAYYSITIGMLVLGAFGLAECGVALDADRGITLRFALIVVALLVGPLQPVSTELGVDVAYPLSENTVLVIQQLFSNLLSAAFIPCFKAMKDFGKGATLNEMATERPSYTFSFYLLIVLHGAATVFFATFNGRYLRYEHELEKKAVEENRKQAEASRAFHSFAPDQQYQASNEQVPLLA